MKRFNKAISTLLIVMLCVTMLIPQGGYAVTKAAVKPTITVDSTTAKAGTSVTVDVSVKDNPGILGMTLNVKYDDGLTLTTGQSGDAFSALTMTKPGKFVSGCNFVWDAQDLSAADVKDGAVLRMVFDVAEDAAAGTDLDIVIECDVTDMDLMAVDTNIINGKVNVIADSVQKVELEDISATFAHNEFNAGDKLDLTDLHVIAEYSDNTTKVLSESEYTVDKSAINMANLGTQYLTISYTEGTVTKTTIVPIRVKAVLQGIDLKPSKTVYKAGEELDLSNLAVMASYSGNQTKRVTNYKTNKAEIDMQTAGTKTVVVSYTENDVVVKSSYKITVEPVLKGIKVSKTKTTYISGDTLNVNDINVVASYIGQNDKTVTSYTTNAASIDMKTPGTKTLVVTYTEGGVKVTGEVAVSVENVLKAISIKKNVVNYTVNDVVDLSDIAVVAKYADGTEAEVDNYTTNADSIDFTTAGAKKLVIQYTEDGVTKSAEITINIVTVAAEINYIEVSKVKTDYFTGEKINVDDLTVTAYYQDGTSAVVAGFITNAATIDMATTGPKKLVVTYKVGNVSVSSTVQINVEKAPVPEDVLKAEEVIKIIANIDQNDWETVVAARNAFDALTDKQKALVTNIADLVKAEQKIETETTDLNTLNFVELDSEPWDSFEHDPAGYLVSVNNPKTGEWDVLYEKTDYVVEYRNNVKVGTGTAILKGKGKYRGVKELKFKIVPLNMSEYRSDFTLTKLSYAYDGKVKKPVLKAKVDQKYYYAPNPTKKNYTVKYSSGCKSVGMYKVTFTFKGNYTGKLTYTFKINPKATYITKLTNAKKGFTVKWKKRYGKMATTRITGYQIRYSTSAKMKNSKLVTVKGYNKISKKISKLKAKKRYYVQVRTYKTVKGVKYYSSWSKAKRVKTR